MPEIQKKREVATRLIKRTGSLFTWWMSITALLLLAVLHTHSSDGTARTIVEIIVGAWCFSAIGMGDRLTRTFESLQEQIDLIEEKNVPSSAEKTPEI
jgi:hypothetical protein